MRLELLKYLLLLFAIGIFFSSCSDDDGTPSEDKDSRWYGLEDFNIEWALNDLVMSSSFSLEGEARGESTMMEASGIAPSILNPGYIWSHNDKGNENLLFLLDEASGKTIVRYRLQGINNRDWEDMEITVDENGNPWIFLADIGDNNRVYPNYTIHKFREPLMEEDHKGRVVNWQPEDYKTYVYTYPEDNKHDSEALLYDLWHDDLYIVTKRDFNSLIYVLSGDEDWSSPGEARLVGNFNFTRAVAGNVSLDGTGVLLKTYERIMYWERSEMEPLWQTFQRKPQLAPYEPVEPQGEAIAFDVEGRGYFTLSEYSNSIIPVLYYYSRIN